MTEEEPVSIRWSLLIPLSTPLEPIYLFSVLWFCLFYLIPLNKVAQNICLLGLASLLSILWILRLAHNAIGFILPVLWPQVTYGWPTQEIIPSKSSLTSQLTGVTHRGIGKGLVAGAWVTHRQLLRWTHPSMADSSWELMHMCSQYSWAVSFPQQPLLLMERWKENPVNLLSFRKFWDLWVLLPECW